MTTYNLTPSVERASQDLFNHFKEIYGKLIFIPLGIGEGTPAKVAPGLAESIQQHILVEAPEGLQLQLQEAKVQVVFDTFVESFFNSLNFIAKGIMKTLGMKLEWEKFKTVMYTNKTSDPASYQTWSKNLSLVLVTIFEAVKTDLQNAGVTVQLTNGTQNFASVQEAVAALPIFA